MGTSIVPVPDTDTQELTQAIPGSGVQRTSEAAGPVIDAPPRRIADRYDVREELGRGGLAVVYRVIDGVRGRELALKQLRLSSDHPLFREQSAAFEREFHTLVQLAHPRIIEVYDFGVDERGRYYTMELLDGGDLKERSPLPWRDACAVIYDVCSSLALLHSRGLLHCDVTPRNVRSTLDGSAKLIDFGALLPMGPSAQVVGTPQFVPPEVLHRSTLDGRSDLFSLGATLYFVLTGRSAFGARRFADLHQAWSVRPAPPSAVVAEIPPALDALVLSLISLDPAARPVGAFEVMQRLAAIAGLERDEDSSVTQAYLATPVLVGRDEPLAALRARIASALAGRGSGVLIRGAAGVGRSRMLDVCALDAKVAGAMVVRVNAGNHGGEPLAVAYSLCEQIVTTMPDLALRSARLEGVSKVLFGAAASGAERDANEAQLALEPFIHEGDGSALQTAITRWLLGVARDNALAIFIDDVHRVDPASLALLATLALSSAPLRLLLVATAESGAVSEAVEAFEVLERECVRLELLPLTEEQTEALALSLFGDVANLALVSDRLHQVALGNARETIDLVQSLITRGTVRYDGGHWVLPDSMLAAELPSSAAEGCRQAVASLTPLACLLAQVHALASHPVLGRSDYGLALPEVSSRQLDRAITELLSQRVLASEGRGYALSRREWRSALLAGLDAAARRDRHRRLAALYASDQALALERADHLLSAGDEDAGVDLLVSLLARSAGDARGVMALSKMSAQQVGPLLERALISAEKLGRKPRELFDIRRANVAMSLAADDAYYLRAAPAWFAQLEQASGLALHAAMTDAGTPTERLTRALTLAAERHAATPEREQTCGPEEAIKGLAYYVVMSIAIGSRMQDGALLASLPPVLEPFAPLSPVLRAIWQNSIATRESNTDNRPESARRRWLEVLDVLAQISTAQLSYIGSLQRAIIYGIGLIEARLGLAAAEQRARLLDDDPFQAVSAMSLRKIARLHQGDFAGAERYRKAGERLALHANVRSMFTSTLQAELIAYALASDLTGIGQTLKQIEPLAARYPGWRAFKDLAEGYYEQARGRPEAALVAFERGLALTRPAPHVVTHGGAAWPRLEAACVEVLLLLGRADEAKARGQSALALAAELGIEAPSFAIRRALALAEAKLGDYTGGAQRVEAVIADMIALGTTGLELGASYEARARMAIWFSDEAAIVEFARHTAKEYRYGEGSSLGARYERLMDEARGEGVAALPLLEEFQTKLTTSHLRGASALSLVAHTIAGAADLPERARRILQLLCEAQGGLGGHLYLREERSLECVASLGDGVRDRKLDEFVRAYAAQQLAATDFATMIVSNQGAQLSSACWHDAEGKAHHPLLLMGERDGEKLCVGVVVIEARDATSFALRNQHLIDAAGDQLLRCGDARVSQV